MGHHRWVMALGMISLGFLWVCHHYGEILLPVWDDEVHFLEPAQNLVMRKGFGTPSLDGLLPGIAHRTYWQPPLYFLILSGWGKVFGWRVLSARWLSRLVGVIGLFLLFALAREWGFPKSLAFLCALWVASDLSYQYIANFARMDVLNAVFLLSTLWMFTRGLKTPTPRTFIGAGIFAGAAILTHLIAAPLVAYLILMLAFRRRWCPLCWFGAPILLGLLLWGIYASLDFPAFLAQMRLQLMRKAGFEVAERSLWLLFFGTMGDLFNAFPLNTPFWFPILIAAALVAKRCPPSLEGWQVGSFLVAYLSAAFGREQWYLCWFTPLGYLALGGIGKALMRKKAGLSLFLLLSFFWSSYQVTKIVKVFRGLPPLRADINRFLHELPNFLPDGATVLLHSIPDPYHHLRRKRPDLHVYELSPTPMDERALRGLKEKAQFFVGIWEWAKRRKIFSPREAEGFHRWGIRVPNGQVYHVTLVRLKKPKDSMP